MRYTIAPVKTREEVEATGEEVPQVEALEAAWEVSR